MVWSLSVLLTIRGLQAVPAFILFFALIPFPYSPRWLASKERYDETLEVLANIHGGGDKTHPVVEAEYNDIILASEEAKLVRWHMMFGRKMWRRTFVGCFTQIWQQLTGGNVMMYYVVYVFNMAGLTGNANLVSSSIQYVIFVAMNVPAMYFIDSWGRRSMLLWGSAGMGAFNFIVGVCLSIMVLMFRLSWLLMDTQSTRLVAIQMSVGAWKAVPTAKGSLHPAFSSLQSMESLGLLLPGSTSPRSGLKDIVPTEWDYALRQIGHSTLLSHTLSHPLSESTLRLS